MSSSEWLLIEARRLIATCVEEEDSMNLLYNVVHTQP